jgi:hypothetical protein
MAQHNASLEKTLQSVFKHKKVGTEVAIAILAVEAMVASGITTAAIVEESDAKTLRITRAGIAHKAFGKRMADAVATLDAIMAEESISVDADPGKTDGAPHKAKLRPIVIKEIANKKVGGSVADMTEKAEKAVDALIAIYGDALNAKFNATTAANLQLIKDTLAA